MLLCYHVTMLPKSVAELVARFKNNCNFAPRNRPLQLKGYVEPLFSYVGCTGLFFMQATRGQMSATDGKNVTK